MCVHTMTEINVLSTEATFERILKPFWHAQAAGQMGPRPDSHPPDGRPTHFIGIRIVAPTALAEIRAAARKCSPGISGYMEEGCRAHVTLGVLRLDTDECVQRCVADFRRAARKLRRERALFPGGVLRVSFDGIGMFGSRVLFLKPSEASISRLREMRACLLDEVDMNQEFQEFHPHLTIAKRTRWVSKRRATDSSAATRMPDDASVFDDVRVEVEACVTTVELLKMGSDKEEDGYYKIEASEPFSGPGP